MKISAILLSYKRPYHLSTIVESLSHSPHISEIIIWNNGDVMPDELIPDGVKLIESPQNYFTYGRFLATEYATGDYIYVQDDDLVVRNMNVLVETATGYPDKVVANLADDKSSRHWPWWQVHKPPFVEIGFGAIFPKRFVEPLLNCPCEETLLHRKADKIFTTIHPYKTVRATDLWRLQYHGKESGRDEYALSSLADHQDLTKQAVKFAQEWKQTVNL